MRLGLGLGIVKSAASIYKGVLDKFPNAVAAYSTRKLKTSYPTTLPADYGGGAAAAYSLRKVKSDYEGSAVKVRRSSDGELQDIGFDSNGNLDTTALEDFVNEQYDLIDEDFSSDLGWTFLNGTSNISGGTLNFSTTTNDYAFYSYGAVPNQVVDIEFTISNYVSGGVFMINFGGGYSSPTYSGNQTVTLTDITNGNGNQNWGFRATSDGFVGSIDNFKVTVKTADGHVTRWYSQSDPVDTYTADFSENDDGFAPSANNSVVRVESVTDSHNTTVNNVIELTCSNNTVSDHSARLNHPFGVSNPINYKTLKCSFKMLVPSSNNEMLGATLCNGARNSDGIVSDGKVTEKGRWTTFTDVAWTQINQSRLTFMGLNDTLDNPEFGDASGEKFYIADVVLTETTDAYNGEGSQQPLIVEGGDVVLENGKAAIEFDGVDDLLDVGQSIDLYSLASEWSIFMDAKIQDYTLQSFQRILVNDSSLSTPDIPLGLQFRDTGDVYFFNNGSVDSTTITSATQRNLVSFIKRSSDTIYAINGTSATGTKGSVDFTTGLEDTTIGNSPNGTTRPAKLKTAELIIFASDQSTNRKDIEWNINNHYSIYDQWDRKSCMNVRRSSDNATQDIGFSGKNINQTQLESFVNDASPVLDDYTGAAAAYSLRKVRSAYTGSAIKVRRSSDDALQDIGFDANGDLDTTTLDTFVNAEVEKVVNGDFATDSDWSISGGTDVTISDGKANFVNAAKGQRLQQNFAFEANKTYKVVFTVSNYSSGTLGFYMGGGYAANNIRANGTYTIDDYTPVNNAEVFFRAMQTGVLHNFSIDSISVLQTTADGHVTTWYDQAGSNNATADCSNPSACEQPLIVEAGDVVLDNNKPAIKFDGVDDMLQKTSASIDIAEGASLFSVLSDYTSGAAFSANSGASQTTDEFLLWASSSTQKFRYGRSPSSGVDVTQISSQQIFTGIDNGSASLSVFQNSTTTNSGTSTTVVSAVDLLTIGARGASSLIYDGKIQELIFFNSDQSGNRLSIEGNIGRYYNITGYRDGFVTKWYDQSGEYNHAENSTSTLQPQIVSNGSMLEENGKAAILSAPLATQNLLRATFTLPQPLSIVGVIRTTLDRDQVPISSQNTTLRVYRRFATSNNFLIQAGINAFTGSETLQQSLEFAVYNGSSGIFALDGNLLVSANFGTNGLDNLDLFQSNGALSSYETYLQEVIVFASDQSGNRTDIEKNINTHFKIYS